MANGKVRAVVTAQRLLPKHPSLKLLRVKVDFRAMGVSVRIRFSCDGRKNPSIV